MYTLLFNIVFIFFTLFAYCQDNNKKEEDSSKKVLSVAQWLPDKPNPENQSPSTSETTKSVPSPKLRPPLLPSQIQPFPTDTEYKALITINRFIISFNKYYPLRNKCNAIGFYALAKSLKIRPKNMIEFVALVSENKNSIYNYRDGAYFKSNQDPEDLLLHILTLFNSRFSINESINLSTLLLGKEFTKKNIQLISFGVGNKLNTSELISLFIAAEFNSFNFYRKAEDYCMKGM